MNLFLPRTHGQRCPRTRPRCSRGPLCPRQRTHRGICSGSASTASDARVRDLGVQEDVLVLVSPHTDESVLAPHPRAGMSVYSTSGSKRMSLHAPPVTPTKPFTQRIKGQRCLRTRPRRSRGHPGTRSRHNDESVLPALPTAATPALMTSLFKRMSSYAPAGTRRIRFGSASTGSDACTLDLGVQEDTLAPAAGTPTNLSLQRPYGQ